MTKPTTTATPRSLRDVIADDSHAFTFQTSGQYRAALLNHEPMEHTHHAEAFAWAVFAKDDNVIIWSKNRAQVESASKEYGRPIVPVIALFAAEQGAAPVPPTHCDPAEGFCAKCREQERTALANHPAPTAPAGDALRAAVRSLMEKWHNHAVEAGFGTSEAAVELDELLSAHQPAQEQAEPTWGAVESVGDMVRNLLTLDQAAPIFTAFHVTIDGERRCRTRGITISRERVVDGKWIDSARKDVPYTHVIWAKPDDADQQAAAPGALDADEMTRLRRLVRAMGMVSASDSTPDSYLRGIMFTVLGQAAGMLEQHAISASGTSEAPQTVAARDVLAERQRQVEQEGWTPAHDDAYVNFELSHAAAAYAYPALTAVRGLKVWPWRDEWLKIRDHRRNMVRAGALVLAEIERMDRAAQLDGGQGGGK
jgi:hypothetical protein